jgi:hypothetical protein
MPVQPSSNTEKVAVASQTFALTVEQLKPLTRHHFYFANVNHNAECTPHGGVLGGDIITDSVGTVKFTFYYNSGLPTTATLYTTYNNLLNNVTGNKIAKLISDDGSSYASYTIVVNNHIRTV